MKKIYTFSAKLMSLFSFCLMANYASAQYCTAGPSSTFDSNVEQVGFPGNSYGFVYNGCPATSGLDNRTAVDSADIRPGFTYSIEIVWGTCNNTYNGWGKAWIDFNNDSIFDPATEEIADDQVTAASQPLTVVYTFTVPANAAIGKTRMRVMQREGGSATSTAPCNSFTWGSNTDFTINIIDCQGQETYSTISETSCQYYTAPSGAQLHDAGTYTDTIFNHLGCDSVITINLSTNNTFSTINPVVCGTYTVPSGSYSVGVSGVYQDTIPNAGGCDSVITINLTNNNSTSSFSTSACNQYVAPSGAIYTLSGVYNDTLFSANALGCDSIMTIDLEMNFDNSLTIFETTCGEAYTSNAGNVYNTSGVYQELFNSVNGCDSIVFIDLLVAEGNATTEVISACDEYTSPSGELYTATGMYTEMFSGVTGCDSSITYDVTIHSINTTATLLSALTIEAAETGASNYQWVDCNNNNMPISGANSQIFIASFNGDYACEVTKNGCTEMTECVRVASLGVEEDNTVFGIYPNPSNGVFMIELTEVSENTKVEITNSAGQVVFQSALDKTNTNISLESIEAGIYFVSISNDNISARKAIVIE